MQKRILILSIVLALCLCMTACGHQSPYDPVEEGQEIRDFTATKVGGGELTLSDLKGKVVMLNFWATWCGPCVGEMPAFPQLVEKYGDDLALVAVDIGEDEDTVKAFLEKNGYDSFTVLLDPDYAVSDLYPSEGIPYTVIIDREGVISALELGADDAETMVGTYSELIDAAMNK